jgi:transcriptional regulator with XRE-family HTH domain
MTRKNFNQLADRVMSDPERAARVREYERAIDAALALAELRKDRELTQSDVAAVLGVSQENISRIEREDDLYISTLRGYVEALGGRLELRAIFPEREVEPGEVAERELAGR